MDATRSQTQMPLNLVRVIPEPRGWFLGAHRAMGSAEQTSGGAVPLEGGIWAKRQLCLSLALSLPILTPMVQTRQEGSLEYLLLCQQAETTVGP